MFGIPNDRLGEVVCAAIKVVKKSVLDEETVKNFCNGNVSLRGPVNSYKTNVFHFFFFFLTDRKI